MFGSVTSDGMPLFQRHAQPAIAGDGNAAFLNGIERHFPEGVSERENCLVKLNGEWYD